MDQFSFGRLRRNLERGRWIAAAQVAALMFVTLLAAGAALLLAGKLQFESLGAGAGPLEVIRAIGLVALACLGATIELGDLPLFALPLGVMAVVAFAGLRAIRDIGSERQDSLGDALKVGLVFAAMCGVASLVFRFGGDVPIEAEVTDAIGLGFVWSSAIAAGSVALGSERAKQSLRELPEGPAWDGGALAGHVARLATYGAVVALLFLVIARLASDPLPRWFGIQQSFAALVYLAAFLPNILVALTALGFGATLRIGAQVGAGGELIGPLREHSLLEWGRGDPPVALFLLALLPLGLSLAAGFWGARRHADARPLASTIAVGAALCGVGMGVLSGLSEARLGAGLVREQGVGLVAVDPTEAALLTTLWLVLGGAAGAMLYRWIHPASRVTVA